MAQDSNAAAAQPAHIDVNNPAQLAEWAKKLDVTDEQLQEAVAAVGDLAPDVEMHLKGTRSTTNSERIAAELVEMPASA